MADGNNKRYICSFVRDYDSELKPNVVVIVAPNAIIARAILCQDYGVVNHSIDKEGNWRNNVEGVKTIRLSDTNTYVDNEGIVSHNPRT